MKILCLSMFFAFAFGISAKAQYIPLLTDTARWIENYGSGSITIVEISSDTIINGKQYQVLNFTLPPFYPLLREDTLSKKVYYLWPDSTSEEILYDFLLSAGDSIFLNYSLATGVPNSLNYDGWMVLWIL